MKASIVHDEHGEIVSISKVGNLKEAGSKFTSVAMVPGKGQRLVEVDLSGDTEKKSLQDLHRDYRVDITTFKLVKRS
jgi:hypothetical protein